MSTKIGTISYFVLLSLKLHNQYKVIHPKYYKHLKKGAHQSHLDRKNELVSGRLDCASSKTEILNKIGI